MSTNWLVLFGKTTTTAINCDKVTSSWYGLVWAFGTLLWARSQRKCVHSRGERNYTIQQNKTPKVGRKRQRKARREVLTLKMIDYRALQP